MSDYLIALIAVLVFLAVLFVVWRGGRLSLKWKDIGVDAQGADNEATEDSLTPAEGSTGTSMSMKASGQGSSITGGKQIREGAASEPAKMDMAADQGAKIKDAEQRISDQASPDQNDPDQEQQP